MFKLLAISILTFAAPLSAEYYYSSAEAPQCEDNNQAECLPSPDFYVQDSNICTRCIDPIIDTPDEAYSDATSWPGKNEDSFYDSFTN